jgi:murein DD-endopeptidase MepM/ murein hydrolase activator NlpD
MKFISEFFFFVLVFISAQLHPQENPNARKNTAGLCPPLNIPLYLSGNYGEIRSTHFHAGIDFKTEQVEGKEVFAVDSGYIYRLVVQPGGYGHALYLRHTDNRITVYGHLRQFLPGVDAWVKDHQYHKKSFEVDLYPRINQFTYRKGELIGYSGNSGSSGGPHLHFEIRDHSGAIPLNVMKYEFPIQDGIKPKINWLSVYPLDNSSQVNGLNRNILIQVSGSNGKYAAAIDDISVTGNIGFGIETVDYLNNTSNPCSPYMISLFKEEELLFRFILDSIPFSHTGYVKSHVDYAEKLRSGKNIQKLFLDPNNRLPIYKVAVNQGIIHFSDTLLHKMCITVSDAYGNESDLKFRVRSAAYFPFPRSAQDDSNIVAEFHYDTLNVFEEADVRIVIPRFALYNNIRFRFSREPSDSTALSDIFNIHDVFTPLNKSYVVSIRPKNLDPKLFGKVLLTGMDEKGQWISQGGNYKNGFVTAQVRNFGRFILAVDTLNPEIIPVNFIPGKEYAEGQVLSFRIRDKESGISKYAGYIDKHWALFEYDEKKDLLTYTVDGKRLERGRAHKLEIIITDNRDNVTRFTVGFNY